MLGGRWEGDGRVLGGRWEGVWRALGGNGLASGEGRPGSLIYRQIKSLHCSGYLLVVHYIIVTVRTNEDDVPRLYPHLLSKLPPDDTQPFTAVKAQRLQPAIT